MCRGSGQEGQWLQPFSPLLPGGCVCHTCAYWWQWVENSRFGEALKFHEPSSWEHTTFHLIDFSSSCFITIVGPLFLFLFYFILLFIDPLWISHHVPQTRSSPGPFVLPSSPNKTKQKQQNKTKQKHLTVEAIGCHDVSIGIYIFAQTVLLANVHYNWLFVWIKNISWNKISRAYIARLWRPHKAGQCS